MFESSNEKFRINDFPINEYPIHAEDYAQQLNELSTHLNLSAEEKLRRISNRIVQHFLLIGIYSSECPLCEKETPAEERTWQEDIGEFTR